jgi:hypothetical protein
MLLFSLPLSRVSFNRVLKLSSLHLSILLISVYHLLGCGGSGSVSSPAPVTPQTEGRNYFAGDYLSQPVDGRRER